MSDIKTALLIYSRPDEIREILETRLEGVKVIYATNPDEVMPALESGRPEAVFSIKGPEFLGQFHRPALEFESVEWIHVGGSGFDHMLPWPDRQVTVTNCAGVLSRFLAQTVTGAMIALNNNLVTYHNQQRQHLWHQLQFTPLAGQTMLIVGLGAVGGHVADLAKALGMKVIAIRQSDTPHPSVDELHKPEALKDVIGRADVVSLHVRLNEDTHHLIDTEMLAAMKPSALLLNTARGPVVDENALIAALKSGHPKAAYLDVFEQEPLSAASELWDLPNVLLSPHTADLVSDWTVRFAGLFCDNLQRLRNDEQMLNVVRA